jgi:hypothetical protein
VFDTLTFFGAAVFLTAAFLAVFFLAADIINVVLFAY